MAYDARVVWQKLRAVTGLILVGLGLVGTLMPVIPGIPLVIAGVALAGPTHPWIRPVTARLRAWRRKRKRS